MRSRALCGAVVAAASVIAGESSCSADRPVYRAGGRRCDDAMRERPHGAVDGERLKPEPQHWLLVRGTGERPPGEHVDPDALCRHSSTRRPAVQKGDLAICYASRWQVIFAVVEVFGDPENEPDRTRWRWHFPIRPLVALRDLRDAPPVEAAGVLPSS